MVPNRWNGAAWSVLPDRSVRAPMAVVRELLGQDPAQVSLPENDHAVPALLPDGPHPALSDRVGSRTSERRPNLRDAQAPQPPVERRSVATIAVMNQKARRLTVPAAAFDDLLSCPLCRGMSGYLDMEDLPPDVMDHEEHIEVLNHRV